MKIIILALLLCSGSIAVAAELPPITTVPEIDVAKYMGTWFEIAHYPNWFQRKCDRNTRAIYTLESNNAIKVVNRCQTYAGDWKEVEGIARKQNPDGVNSKLEVLFAPRWLGWIPFVWGSYWIIDLALDYSYAVVGESSRKYLWILSRTPKMEPEVLKQIEQKLELMGYHPDQLLFTKHD